MACNKFDPACTKPGTLKEVQLNNLILEPFVHDVEMKLFGTSHREFRFEPGVTFLSTWQQVVIGAAIYLTIVLGGRELMKRREAFQLKWLFVVHNVVLVAASGLLLALMLEILVPMISQHGLRWSVCEPGAYDLRLVPFYYFNYLIKWWEFIDTFFLVLKKKPLEFLHVYHHAATMVLTYSQMVGYTAVQWVPITINLLVHVIMYYYYARTTVSKKPVWWKKYLTSLQIAQFIIDLTVIYYIMYNALVVRLELPFPTRGDCYGDLNAGYFGTAVISSYLLLFIDFFIRTYRKGGRSAGKKEVKANGTANGHANGHAANGEPKANGAVNGSPAGLRKRVV
ncbi:fatty acid elongase [Hyaloraphidium curvatum]|nr:fatty acid elongase [Hyaloraphidium curvatum]